MVKSLLLNRLFFCAKDNNENYCYLSKLYKWFFHKKIKEEIKRMTDYNIQLKIELDKAKSKATINSNINALEKQVSPLRLKVDTSKIANSIVEAIQNGYKNAASTAQIKLPVININKSGTSKSISQFEDEYQKLMTTAQKINALQFEISGLDVNKNKDEIDTLTKKLNNFKNKFASLSENNSSNFSTEQWEELQAVIGNTDEKIAAFKAKKLENIQCKIDTGDYGTDLLNIQAQFLQLGLSATETKNQIAPLQTAYNNLINPGKTDKRFENEIIFQQTLQKSKDEIANLSSAKVQNVLTSDLVGEFEAFNSLYSKSSMNADDLSKELGGVDQRIVDYVKTCEKGEATTNGFAKSVSGISTASTLGSIALKGLSAAGGMVVSALVDMALSWAVNEIDKWIHSAERAQETAENFSLSFKNFQSSQKDNTKTISDLNEEYQLLSNGVDNLGNNLSLSTSEYERYHEIVNQIVDLMPELNRGWDAQGNAILDTTQKIDNLNEKYKQTKKNEAAKLYNEKTDDDENVTEEVLEDLYNNIEYTGTGQTHSVDTNEYVKTLDEIADMTYDEIRAKNLIAIESKKSRNGLGNVLPDISQLSPKDLESKYKDLKDDNYLSDKEKTYKNVLDVLKQNYSWAQISAMSQDELKDNYNSSLNNLDLFQYAISDIEFQKGNKITLKEKYDNGKIETYARTQSNNLKTKLESSEQSTSERALLYAQGFSDENIALSDEQSTIVNTFLGNMSSGLIKSAGVDSEETLQEFVNNFIHEFAKEGSTIAPALSKLFSIDLDSSDLSLEEYQNQIDVLIAQIANSLNIDDTDSLKETLGFDIIDTTIENRNNAINSSKKKLKGTNKKDLTQFFQDNSINTQEEIDKWNEISNNYKNASDVKKEYLAWKSSNTDSTSTKPISFKKAWDNLDKTDNDTFLNLKSNLIELSESGQLTVEAFNNIDGSNTFIKQIGLTAEETVQKINNLTDSTKQLSALKPAISSIQNAYNEKEEKGVVGADTLSSMETTFGSLGKSWEKYKQIAGSANSSTSDLTRAQNDLATAYINSGNFLSGLVDETGNCTEANKQYYISQLESIGIENAKAVVENTIIQQKADLALSDSNLVGKSNEECIALVNETMQLAGNNEELQNYIFYKALASQNALDTSDSISNLIALAEQCGISGRAIQSLITLQGLKQTYDEISASGNADAQHALPELQSQIDAETENLKKLQKSKTKKNKKNFNATNITKPQPSETPGGTTAATESKQTFDWIERRVTRLNAKISLLNAQKENIFTIKNKKKNLNSQIKETTRLINTYSSAYSKYMKKANNVGLSETLKKKVQNGQINGENKSLIQEYGQENANKIQDYQNYYDKAQSAKQSKWEAKASQRKLKEEKYQNYVDKYNALAEFRQLKADDTSLKSKKRNKHLKEEKKYLEKSYKYQIKIAKLNKDSTEKKRLQTELQQKLVELTKKQFDNIANRYERKIQNLGYDTSYYDNKIAEIEASGAKINRSYYDAKKSNNNRILSQYKAELSALEKKLPSIKKGTDEYYDALEAIQACKDSISGCVQTTYELNNAINQLNFDRYENISEKISRIMTEQDFLQGLFSHEKTVDDETGNFTDAGLAKLGSISTNYYAAKQKSKNDSELLEELKNVKSKGKQTDGTYKLGKWTFNSLDDLNKKIDETYTTWQNDIKETYDLETNIADLMKEKYQAELDLLQKLINDKKDALQAEKDLHDYQKSITEKTNDISTIQKQIAAYSGDTSQEGLAKLQKLQKELVQKQDELRETEYEKYISDQEDMLDKLYTEYEELITKKLDDFYSLISTGLNTANQNTDIIAKYLQEIAVKNGYTIENGNVVKSGDINKNVNNAVNNFKNTENNNSSNSSSPKTTVSGYYSPVITDSNGKPYFRNNNNSMRDYAINFIKKNATPAKKAYHKYADLNRIIYSNPKNVFGFGKKKKVLKVDKMKELASMMGFIYDNPSKSGALYQKLHSVGVPGFKNGGIGELIKSQGEDGIAFVRNGEGFISPENVPEIKKLIKSVPFINELTKSLIKSPNLPGIPALSNMGNNIEANYNFTLENCNNAEDIIYQIQTSSKIQKAIQSVSVDRIAGGGRLGVQNIK